MEVYTIAKTSSECYGHGSYGDELQIHKEGAYGQGSFPPAFKTKEAAEAYLKSLPYSSDMVIVSLEVRE